MHAHATHADQVRWRVHLVRCHSKYSKLLYCSRDSQLLLDRVDRCLAHSACRTLLPCRPVPVPVRQLVRCHSKYSKLLYCSRDSQLLLDRVDRCLAHSACRTLLPCRPVPVPVRHSVVWGLVFTLNPTPKPNPTLIMLAGGGQLGQVTIVEVCSSFSHFALSGHVPLFLKDEVDEAGQVQPRPGNRNLLL